VVGRPLGSRLKATCRACPLCIFFWWQVRGMGFVRVWASEEKERKREKIQGSNAILPLPLRIQGKKENSAVQNGTIVVFFLRKRN